MSNAELVWPQIFERTSCPDTRVAVDEVFKCRVCLPYNTQQTTVHNCLAQLISDASRRLQSSDTFTFAVPRTRTRLGDRLFAVAGPQIWNSLPADLCLVDNYARFRRLLKGHMFG